MMPPNSADRPDPCPRCGSTHFQIATFMQYTVFPGGGYRTHSRPHQAVVCLCGRPISTSRLNPRDAEDLSFLDSMKVAAEYRERTGPDLLMAELRRDFLTHEEFQALSDQVSTLEAVLQQLSKNDQEKDQKDQKVQKKDQKNPI